MDGMGSFSLWYAMMRRAPHTSTVPPSAGSMRRACVEGRACIDMKKLMPCDRAGSIWLDRAARSGDRTVGRARRARASQEGRGAPDQWEHEQSLSDEKGSHLAASGASQKQAMRAGFWLLKG